MSINKYLGESLYIDMDTYNSNRFGKYKFEFSVDGKEVQSMSLKSNFSFDCASIGEYTITVEAFKIEDVIGASEENQFNIVSLCIEEKN